MPELRNATEFIDSYNKIDAQLRDLYGYKPSQSFTDIVRRSAEKNAVVRRFEEDLSDYARLRNAIVHQSTDGRIIAVPCDEAVQRIRRIEKLLCTPPRIAECLPDKRVTSIDAGLNLRRAVLLIAQTGYSNLPVYRGKKMVGILNNRRIICRLGEVIRAGRSVDAYLAETEAGSAVDASDLSVYYRYLGKDEPLQAVLDAFSCNRKLLAVCVTENGRTDERIVHFVTAADLPRIQRILEDYE